MTTSPEETPIVDGLIAPGSILGTDVYVAVDTTDPTQSAAGSTKTYTISQLYNFIAIAQGLNVLTPALAATTVNYPANYNNGVLGVGATLTSAVPTVFIADGILPAVGSRILVFNQTLPAQNGIYVLTQQGDGVVSNYILTRAADFNQASNIAQYDVVLVELGATYGGKAFQETGAGTFTIGTTPITFSQYITPSIFTSGTFTPILAPSSGAFTTITYSTQSGYFSQNGKVVNFVINITLSAFSIGTGINFLELTGYPWVFNNSVGVQTFSIMYASVIGTASYTSIVPFYSSGLGTMGFYLLNPNNTVGVVAAPSLLSATTSLYISGTAIVN